MNVYPCILEPIHSHFMWVSVSTQKVKNAMYQIILLSIAKFFWVRNDTFYMFYVFAYSGGISKWSWLGGVLPEWKEF